MLTYPGATPRRKSVKEVEEVCSRRALKLDNAGLIRANIHAKIILAYLLKNRL